MAEKIKVYYEFRQISTDQVLVLDKPAQVTFQLWGGLGANTCIINNAYILVTRLDSLDILGGAKYDWQLVLNNNENEIDVTNYQIRFTGPGTILMVIIKYYENPSL